MSGFDDSLGKFVDIANSRLVEVMAERGELRAENERLTGVEKAADIAIEVWRHRAEKAEAEVERLTTLIGEERTLRSELEFARACERRSSQITDEVVLAAWRGFSAMMCDDGEARVATYSELRAMRAALEAVWPTSEPVHEIERFDGPCAGCGGYIPCDCLDQLPTRPHPRPMWDDPDVIERAADFFAVSQGMAAKGLRAALEAVWPV